MAPLIEIDLICFTNIFAKCGSSVQCSGDIFANMFAQCGSSTVQWICICNCAVGDGADPVIFDGFLVANTLQSSFVHGGLDDDGDGGDDGDDGHEDGGGGGDLTCGCRSVKWR